MLLYVCSHLHSNHLTYTENLQIVSEMSYRTLTKALLKSRRNIPAELQCHQITISSKYFIKSISQALYSIITCGFVLSIVTRKLKMYVLYYKTVLKVPAYTYSWPLAFEELCI